MAPAQVLHGAVRLQGLTSSPTPDTHVRVAWANAPVEKPATSARPKAKRSILEIMFIGVFLLRFCKLTLSPETMKVGEKNQG